MTMPHFKLDVIESIDALEPIRDEWNQFVDQTNADIYFSYDWVKAWWHSFGYRWNTSRRLYVLLFRTQSSICGILPFFIDTIWVGPFNVKIARLVGVDPNYAVLGLPLREGIETDLVNLACSDLVLNAKCDAISFTPLSNLAPELEAIRKAAQRNQVFEIGVDESHQKHTVMRLPEDFDAFLAALSKSTRREYRRDVKKLEAMYNLATKSSDSKTVANLFSSFVDLHESQWKLANRAGHFEDWPGSRDFYTSLSSRLSPEKRMSIDEHVGDDTLLSSQLRFKQKNRAYWRLVARRTDPALAKIGVGRVGLVERVRDLIAEGVTFVEAGSGEYDYKLSLGGELVDMHRIILKKKSSAPTLKFNMLMALARALNYFYYRALFLKILPVLRQNVDIGTRPLWKIWIRTRL